MKFQFEYDGKCMTCGDCPCFVLDDVTEDAMCGITFHDISASMVAAQGNCPLIKVGE